MSTTACAGTGVQGMASSWVFTTSLLLLCGRHTPHTAMCLVHVTPSALHVTPSALHVTPSALHVTPSALHVTPSALHVTPGALHVTCTILHIPLLRIRMHCVHTLLLLLKFHLSIKPHIHLRIQTLKFMDYRSHCPPLCVPHTYNRSDIAHV